LLLTSYY